MVSEIYSLLTVVFIWPKSKIWLHRARNFLTIFRRNQAFYIGAESEVFWNAVDTILDCALSSGFLFLYIRLLNGFKILSERINLSYNGFFSPQKWTGSYLNVWLYYMKRWNLWRILIDFQSITTSTALITFKIIILDKLQNLVLNLWVDVFVDFIWGSWNRGKCFLNSSWFVFKLVVLLKIYMITKSTSI